jgi:hypothetical protein
VESVIRETADKVLSEPGVPKEKLAMRTAALELMAEVSRLTIGTVVLRVTPKWIPAHIR